MGVILTNHDAEALILDIRAALAAKAARVGPHSGGFLVFPSSVVVPRAGRGQLVFPICTDVEPGSLCHDDGTASVRGLIDGIDVEGTFSWVVGRSACALSVPAATYRFCCRGRDVGTPAWADQLPVSQRLTRRPPALLVRDRHRLMRQGRLAEYWLLHLTRRFFERCCEGPLGRAIEVRAHVDMDDVVQRGMIVATRLLPLYASSDRPPCSWLRMLALDAKRDMGREVGRLDWMPQKLGDVLTRARAAGIALNQDPSITLGLLLEGADAADLPAPRVSVRQVQRALSAPHLVPLDILNVTDLDLPDRDVIGEIEVPGRAPGVIAAVIARLVCRQPELTALAFLGEPLALMQVGRAVIAAVRQAGETERAARRRCRSEFLSSGRLFTSEAGYAQFGAAVGPGRLAAIDAALGAVIGLELPPAV
jgi:hypothetical protein